MKIVTVESIALLMMLRTAMSVGAKTSVTRHLRAYQQTRCLSRSSALKTLLGVSGGTSSGSSRKIDSSSSSCPPLPSSVFEGKRGEDRGGDDEDSDPRTFLNEAFIGLGSNQGHRHANLLGALNALAALPGHTHVVCTSMLYESAPMYVEDQPRFLNAAVRLRTSLTPGALLLALKDIEQGLGRNLGGGAQQGRSQPVRWGPRPIDLDLLLFAEVCAETAETTAETKTDVGAEFEWVRG
eukprot:CAMPEP_0171926174 /NCGR_PEP_ID=MMETSP0993-20121228/24689_1 /TAXON_ID=483369 /ORGANISM="non described non described, Strain CCMP2098" /LENGTH=238 /DNA_ID=CAMNT_0012564971 /DNA_START=47 /DNA_END=759 /DNA_ORIENTATION=-